MFFNILTDHMAIPKIIEGKVHSDSRGNLSYNNSFDLSDIKRMYFIENIDIDLIRGWTGHRIEQRWFVAVSGSFKIRLIQVGQWNNPARDLNITEYYLTNEKLMVLYVPPGYASAIQALEKGSKLMIMADYSIGETNDEYRFSIDYFENLK